MLDLIYVFRIFKRLKIIMAYFICFFKFQEKLAFL